MLPLIIAAAAGGVYALHKLWPNTCDHSDVDLRYNDFVSWMTQLTAQVQRMQSTPNSAIADRAALISSRFTALATQVQQLKSSTAQTLGSSTLACYVLKEMDSLQDEMHAVSAQVGALIGEPSVIPSTPMSTTSKLILGGAILGGGYLAYKYWSGHGGNIPRKSLPRYAGGTRRLR